jgi:hypothetical protein
MYSLNKEVLLILVFSSRVGKFFIFVFFWNYSGWGSLSNSLYLKLRKMKKTNNARDHVGKIDGLEI